VLIDVSSSTKYRAVNACIYCGAVNVSLTDEHIVQDGLGGRHELPKASCQVCQRIINEEFEQYCLRSVLGTARAHFRLKGKSADLPANRSSR
jgi:hypothetical protein